MMSVSDRHAFYQKFILIEEKVLAQYILRAYESSFPLTSDILMIAPTNSYEIKALKILLTIIDIIVSLKGIQTFQQDILDVLIVNVRKQKIQTNLFIGFAVFIILASNRASLNEEKEEEEEEEELH